MALTEQELEEIKNVYEEAIKAGYKKQVMVGFNRRFAPAVKEVKKLFVADQPKTISIRVNAGVMPPDHWVNDALVGGGRIIGEGCHFIDLAMFLAGSRITAVSAEAMEDANRLNNSVVINLSFANGSVASVNYFSNGSKSLSKEQIEVFCGGTVARIDDFKTLTIYGKSTKEIKFKGQDKGHETEVKEFLASVAKGTASPISFEDCYHSSLATLKVMQSIKESRKIVLE